MCGGSLAAALAENYCCFRLVLSGVGAGGGDARQGGVARLHSGLGEHRGGGGGGANDSLMANGRTFSRDGGQKK